MLGDNVAQRSVNMPWYGGPALLEHLQQAPASAGRADDAFRFPVQLVIRDGQDFRGLAGTVASGSIAVGEEVVDAVSARRARVARIAMMGRELASASAGQAVVIGLDRDLDLSRGAVLGVARDAPGVAHGIDARLVWLSEEPFDRERGYLLRTATDIVPIASISVRAHLDLEALSERPAATCVSNDIALVRIDLGRKVALDLFADQRETGSFVLIDPITGTTVAGGVVTALRRRESVVRSHAFRLTRDVLERGLGADLPPTGVRSGAAPPRQRGGDPDAGRRRCCGDRRHLAQRRHRPDHCMAWPDRCPFVRIRRRHPVGTGLRHAPPRLAVDRRDPINFQQLRIIRETVRQY